MTMVAVVGGGLAGLVAARRLAAAGADVRLFERREEVGGRVRSLERDGFVLDRGFQVLFTAYPAARRELDYDALRLRSFPPGAIVARDGERELLADPLREPSKLSAALFSRAVTTGDKLRTLRLRRRLARTPDGQLLGPDDETIREGLGRLGFSPRFVEGFAAPLYGGITLDRSLSTSMGVFRYTWKMLSTGAAAVPATGMGAIPRQLAERAEEAGASVETGRRVASLTTAGDVATLAVGDDTVAVDGVVVATGPRAAAELTGLASIPTDGRGCVTQFYALPAERALGVDGRLLLNAEGDAPNHVVAHSEVAPAHAPVGRSLLSATFPGQPEAGEASLAERTRMALESWFPERTFDGLEVVHTERIPFAQLAQPPGFLADRPAPDAPEGPVVLAGDYTRWSSIQGALESGRVAARTMAESLRL